MSEARSKGGSTQTDYDKSVRDNFLRTLLSDVSQAIQKCEAEGDAAAHRTAVRAIFAAIEGTIWEYRKHVRSIATSLDLAISPTTSLALDEVSYSVTAAGVIVEQPRYIALPTMFRLTTKIAQQCSPNLTVDFSAQGWSDFQTALKIRHRITHPKKMEDLSVGPSDLTFVRAGFDWLLSQVVKGMAANHTSLTDYLTELKQLIADLDAGDERTWKMYRQIKAAIDDPDSC